MKERTDYPVWWLWIWVWTHCNRVLRKAAVSKRHPLDGLMRFTESYKAVDAAVILAESK